MDESDVGPRPDGRTPVTKAAQFKLVKDVEQLGAVSRYLVACFTTLGLIQKTGEDGANLRTFVDPDTFSMLPVLKRGFFGRLQWLFFGR